MIIQKKPQRTAVRSEYGIQQQLMEMLYKLQDKKSSQLFRMPVDSNEVIDYYQKISNPMDMSTIFNKLREGKYYGSFQVLNDLNLIISNCNTYNNSNAQILKKSDMFLQCIKTEWNNFQSSLAKKGIDVNQEIIVTQQILNNFNQIQQRRKKKRVSLAFNTLDIDKRNKYGENQYEYYSHMFNQQEQKNSFDTRIIKNQDPFSEFQIKVEGYNNLTQEQKKARMKLTFDEDQINDQFNRVCKKKLQKYKKIISKKIKWCEQKILMKINSSKKYSNLSGPAYLLKSITDTDITKNINIRKLQLFIKQIAYWIQAFQHVLGQVMKQKFLNTCRSLRKSVVQVIRYKRILSKSTKIILENPFIESIAKQEFPQQPGGLMTQELADQKQQTGEVQTRSNLSQQTKQYQHKMKEFRRILDRDKKQATIRITKFQLVMQNGEVIRQEPTQSESKNKKFRPISRPKDTFRIDNPREDQDKLKFKQLFEEKQKDKIFIDNYNKLSNIEIIRKYGKRVKIDWEKGLNLKREWQQKNEQNKICETQQ